MTNSIEEKISLINKFIFAYSIFDLNSIQKIIDENLFEFKNISQGEILEHASNFIEFSLILEQSKIMFKDRTIEISNLNIKEFVVEAETIVSTTMAIGTPDGLRAGQKLNFKAKFIFNLSGDKITKLSLIS